MLRALATEMAHQKAKSPEASRAIITIRMGDHGPLARLMEDLYTLAELLEDQGHDAESDSVLCCMERFLIEGGGPPAMAP